MLLSVMYHHVGSDKYSNDLAVFEEHLAHIKEHFVSVLPSEEKLAKNSICLTFDDGYADFYFRVFPLLQKYELKALLGVCTKYILDECTLEADKRMGFMHDEAFANYKNGAFCTYEELKEMCQSTLVEVASHSHSHIDLTKDEVDLELELKHSKELLEQNLEYRCDSFIFPFGKYNNSVILEAKKHYKYLFRIGNGLQGDFSGIDGLIYRINGDSLGSKDAIFKPSKMLKYHLKSTIKRIF